MNQNSTSRNASKDDDRSQQEGKRAEEQWGQKRRSDISKTQETSKGKSIIQPQHIRNKLHTMRRTDLLAVVAALAASAAPAKAQQAPWYHVSSKTKTDPSTFKQFFDELGSSEADVVIEEGAPWQMAYVRLDDAQLQDVKNQTWLDYVTLGENTTETESDDFLVMPHLAILGPHLQKRAYVEQDPTVAPQLKMISPTPPGDTSTEFDPNTNELYRYDDSAGANQWIYILDTGYDLSISDLQPDGRQVESFVVPNLYTVGDLPPSQPPPEQDPFQRYRGPQEINDVGSRDSSTNTFLGHGTGVASAAAGIKYGVAKKANLYLIKAKGSFYQNRGSGQQSHLSANYKLEGVERGLLNMMGHFYSNRLDRAVVNMSWGVKRRDDREVDKDSPWGKLWQKFIEDTSASNIAVTIAAGNEGNADNEAPQTRLGDTVPQRFDTPDNHLITVGALTGNGAWWDQTTRPGPSSHNYPNEDPNDYQGNQDTYAMGDQTIKYQSVGGVERNIPGTSIAAPQVAGLIAYLFQHPVNGLDWNAGNTNIAQKAKDAMTCLYDPAEQNGCFQVYWNGPGSVNNGARFNDGANGGGGGQASTGICYTDVSNDLYGQCQWEGESGIVQVAACAEDSACPGNESPCMFRTGSDAAQCAAA